MKEVTELPLLAKPSAGVPMRKDNRLVYPCSPDDFAAYCLKLVDAGATMIGGCCGTTPTYIALLKRTLREPADPNRKHR